MVNAVHSKRGKYDPVKWMIGGAEIKRRAAREQAAKAPMTGDEILRRLKHLGMPVIDKRQTAKGD